MIAIKPTQLRENLKDFCDQVVKGETIIVSRPNNENVVVVSEKEYNAMQKAAQNAEYLAKLDQSMAELEAGNIIVKTMEELREYER